MMSELAKTFRLNSHALLSPGVLSPTASGPNTTKNKKRIKINFLKDSKNGSDMTSSRGTTPIN